MIARISRKGNFENYLVSMPCFKLLLKNETMPIFIILLLCIRFFSKLVLMTLTKLTIIF